MGHRSALLAAALALPLLVGGCTADEQVDPAPRATSTAPVVQLGAPGEGNRQLTPEEAAELAAREDEASQADIAFARDMVPHHQQALAMVALAEQHAGPEVALLAERMKVSQVDEVAQLEQWLASLGPLPPDEHASHDGDAHALMPGMLTDDQLTELAEARGARFDQLFLASMIRHHEGATAMVADLQSRPDGGQHPWLAQFAREVDTDQRIEIARMRGMLTGS